MVEVPCFPLNTIITIWLWLTCPQSSRLLWVQSCVSQHLEAAFFPALRWTWDANQLLHQTLYIDYIGWSYIRYIIYVYIYIDYIDQWSRAPLAKPFATPWVFPWKNLGAPFTKAATSWWITSWAEITGAFFSKGTQRKRAVWKNGVNRSIIYDWLLVYLHISSRFWYTDILSTILSLVISKSSPSVLLCGRHGVIWSHSPD